MLVKNWGINFKISKQFLTKKCKQLGFEKKDGVKIIQESKVSINTAPS